jgi:NAD(P)-dependent dehydrogenase (short-subunit alcohol dehydrogenase family)
MRTRVKLKGKIVVVTGAGNGIGRELLLELERATGFIAKQLKGLMQ